MFIPQGNFRALVVIFLAYQAYLRRDVTLAVAFKNGVY